jgi:hypothetical protein
VLTDADNINQFFHKRIKSRVLWTVLVFALFAATLLPGLPYWLPLPLLFVVFLYVSISYPIVGLFFLAFAHSFSGLVRWKEQDAILLSGFGTILIVLFFVGVICRGLLGLRFRIPFERTDWQASKAMFLVWLLFIALIFFNVLANWKEGMVTIMMFREYIIPLLIFPVAVSVLLSSRPSDCRGVLMALFLGCTIVGLVNIIHYIVDLPLPIPRWVRLFDATTGIAVDLPDSRIIFGSISIPRMQHILGLSGAAAGGVYFITMALMGYFLARHSPIQNWRWVLYLGSLVNTVAAFLTLSFSLAVAFGFVAIYLYLALRKGMSIARTIFVSVVVILILMLLLPDLGGESSPAGILDYIDRHLSKSVYPTLTGFHSFLLGDGLGLKSAGALGLSDFLNDKHNLLTDQWLLVALYQLGIIGFVLVIAFFALPLWMSFRILSCRGSGEMGYLSVVAGIVVAGFIGFSHGAAPVERLFSIPMVLAIAVIVVIAKGLLPNSSLPKYPRYVKLVISKV